MKKCILSILLIVAMMVSLMAFPVSAANADEKTDGTQYQTVFVHGLLGFGYNDAISDIISYWGFTSGQLIDYLQNQGYDVIDAAVGPISSCWDRCCELFAQLTGTKTDYGAVHSATVTAAYANESNDLKHDRFGRDYTGGAIVDNWGPIYKDGKVTGWYDNKINLIGHSFGGPTSLLLTKLLAEGNQDEINWGKEQAKLYGGDWHDYVSPLFWGGHDGEYLINSITGLAAVFNGTTYLSACKDEGELIMTLVAALANTAGLTDIAYLYDFQLEHFGISKTPGEKLTDEQFFSSKKISAFLDGYDNALYDLSIAGCNYLKQGWDTYDNIYYFSYAGNRTHQDPLTGNCVPDADMQFFFIPFGVKMGSADFSFIQVMDINGKYVTNADKDWRPNDGLVNTISARYPFGAPQKEYDANSVEPGIWQWQIKRYDHLTFCGGLLDPKILSQPIEARQFYLELMNNIEDTTPINPGDLGKGLPFADVSSERWSYQYIKELYEAGVVNGKTPTAFDPQGKVTRAQFVKMIGCLEGIDIAEYETCGFKDVSSKSVFAPYIEWASEAGIVNGYDAEQFRPGENIKREQMAAIICRYCAYAGIDLENTTAPMIFTDEARISAYAKDYVHTLQQAGIINGFSDGSYRPAAYTTREQACKVLCLI